jgi:hypothetical protein
MERRILGREATGVSGCCNQEACPLCHGRVRAREIENISFKLWYSDLSGTRNGVGVLIDNSLKDEVVDLWRNGIGSS